MKKAEMKEQIAALQAQVDKLQRAVNGAETTINDLNKRVYYYQYPTPSLAMQKLVWAFQHDRWSGFTAISERMLKATYDANIRAAAGADEKFTSDDARRMLLASPEFQKWIIKSYVGGDK